MAAVVVAARRNDERNKEDTGRTALDEDKDGSISADSILQALPDLSIQVNVLLERLELESEMQAMCLKMPLFLILFFCFIHVITILAPAPETARIHRRLKDHYGIMGAFEVKEFASLYTYIEEFEARNAEMQPTSSLYWCEKDYTTNTWDDKHDVPMTTCASPRMHALERADTSAAWSKIRSSRINHRLSSPSDVVAEDPAANSRGRRLKGAESSRVSSTSDVLGEYSVTTGGQTEVGGSSFDFGDGMSGEKVGDVPKCEDNTPGLQRHGDDTLTCSGNRDTVCESDLGIFYCPRSCGYCSPWTYEKLKKFPRTQVTMMPVVVYQSRFKQTACKGFAHDFETQAYNPSMSVLPPMDGPRNGRVMTCVDRESTLSDAFGYRLDCPAAMDGSARCQEGYVEFIPKHTIGAEQRPIYAKFLVEPSKDLQQMKAMGWLDVQTQQVVLSTLVYTSGLEIFTAVDVVFDVDFTGNVDVTYRLVSYRDVVGEDRSVFVGLSVFVVLGSFLGIVLTVLDLFLYKWGGKAYRYYEVASRLILGGFTLVMVVSWTFQISMSAEYLELLNTVLGVEDTGAASNATERRLRGDALAGGSQWAGRVLNAEGASSAGGQNPLEAIESHIQHFFDVKTHIEDQSQWLLNIRIACYLVLYVQFAQMIFYFNSHPKMALLTKTIKNALGSMVHFLTLFCFIFLNLAFIAHWMLGDQLEPFRTFSSAVEAQTRMLFGEFIYSTGVENLDNTLLAMYWLYAITFMLVVFFTLLNFFLAIVVDAYVDVKDENRKAVTSQDFLSDCYDVFKTTYKYVAHGWPARSTIIKYLIYDMQGHCEPVGGQDHEVGMPNVNWLFKAEKEALKFFKDKLGDDYEEKQAEIINLRPEAFLQFFEESITEEELANFLAFYFQKCRFVVCKRQPSDYGAAAMGGAQAKLWPPPRLSRGTTNIAEDDGAIQGWDNDAGLHGAPLPPPPPMTALPPPTPMKLPQVAPNPSPVSTAATASEIPAPVGSMSPATGPSPRSPMSPSSRHRVSIVAVTELFVFVDEDGDRSRLEMRGSDLKWVEDDADDGSCHSGPFLFNKSTRSLSCGEVVAVLKDEDAERLLRVATLSTVTRSSPASPTHSSGGQWPPESLSNGRLLPPPAGAGALSSDDEGL